MTQGTQLARDEERQRLAISEACQAQQHAVAAQLLQSQNGLLYPAYMRLVDKFRGIRIECMGKWLAVRAHRKNMRDDGAK